MLGDKWVAVTGCKVELMVEVDVPACERAPMEGGQGHPAGGRRFVLGDDAIEVA
jgi:hypothetical protein